MIHKSIFITAPLDSTQEERDKLAEFVTEAAQIPTIVLREDWKVQFVEVEVRDESTDPRGSTIDKIKLVHHRSR